MDHKSLVTIADSVLPTQRGFHDHWGRDEEEGEGMRKKEKEKGLEQFCDILVEVASWDHLEL